MHLKPVLGPVQLTFYSVGVIIGAGVYSVIGAAAGLAGHSLWLSEASGHVPSPMIVKWPKWIVGRPDTVAVGEE